MLGGTITAVGEMRAGERGEIGTHLQRAVKKDKVIRSKHTIGF